MRGKQLGYLILKILLTGNLIGCDSSSDPAETAGSLKVSITDAPAEFQAVNITFSEVSVISSGEEPILVSDSIQTINLIKWSNGLSTPLGNIKLDAGTYNQIRLIIDSASVIIDGIKSSVKVPSGAQSGLKLTHQFTIEAGSTYDLMIDFDASRSIVRRGSPPNPSYLLKPTIRLISAATTGSISGTVNNPVNTPVSMALSGTDTISTTFVDTISGDFQLAFLPSGEYNVIVKDTTGARFDSSGVEVTLGTDNNLGTIDLE